MSFLSSFSLVFGVIPKLVDLVYTFFKKKNDTGSKLRASLDRIEIAIASALRDGRITDAAVLSRERNEVLRKLHKTKNNAEVL